MRRNQDFASIIAIFALLCHFARFPINGKCSVLRTQLTLMENEKVQPENQISQTKARLDSCILTSRVLEAAAFLCAIISVTLCYRAIKARESGALVALFVLVVIFLVAGRMN